MEATKERIAKGYSHSAPRYDALAGHLYLMGIRRLLPRARTGPMPAILDVGCGTGVNLLEAARWFAPTRQLCGIDISPGMVAVASAKASALGIPASFVVGDAEHLPYDHGQFDLVICNSVLHWFKNRGAALQEIHRVLRPGGQLLLICAAAPGFREWFAFTDQLRELIGLSPRSSLVPDLPTAAEVGSLMQGAGFVLEHLANPVQFHQVTDYESFVRLMSTVAPLWTADLPAGAESAVEELAAKLMRAAFPGSFPNTWAAIEAVGTRFG